MSNISERLDALSPAKRALLTQRLKEKGQRAPKKQTIPRRSEGSPSPLSLAQQRLWFLHQLQPESAFYNTAGAMRLTGSLNAKTLEQTLGEIVRRHDVLQTVFPAEHGKPLQIINRLPPLSLPVTDLSDLPAAERERRAARLINDESERPFDLAGGPLFRAVLLRLGADEHVLLITMHHIISDGWSIGVFLREMTELYVAFSKALPSPLPELTIQYADYASWQEQWLNEEVLGEQLDYWKRQLQGSNSTIDFSFDHPAPAAPTHRAGVESINLPPALAKSLEALSRQEDVTLFMTLLTAFYVLLYRYTGQDDINVGSPIAGRSRVETEQLIGFFINSLVLRGDLSGNPSFRVLLRRVREMVLDAQGHQDVPFEKVVEALQPERSLMQTPLFQTVFSTDSISAGSFELPGLTVAPFSVSNETTEFDLMCWVTKNGEQLSATMTYSADLFEAPSIRRMLGHYETLLENIVKHAGQSIAMLPLMSHDEEQMVLFRWNDNETPYQHTSIHEAFLAQVRRKPDAVSLIFEGEQLTYRALNERANQLAHYLRDVAGVEVEARVGICVERSFEMVIAVLGVLKAGAAYVPLDAAYPMERLSLMLTDSDVKVLLTQSSLAPQLPKHHGEVLCLDTAAELIAAQSTADLPPTATPTNLAYIIYTSGSTGRPKGVMLQHGGVCNMAEAQMRDFELAPDGRVLQFASFSFDGAVSEMFLALLGGATLCLAPPQSLMPGDPLSDTLRRQAVTCTVLPPSVLAVLSAEDFPALRTVVAAGEACPPHIVARWAEGRLFINGYGPTENTVCTTLGRCDGSEAKPPIGHPIDNVQVYLLDAKLQPVPIGVAGGLYISSVGLARGYLHLPALTAERFLPNPYSRHPGSRLYQTGDIARRLDGGAIDFVGRADEQVKLRGYRIELGEIEAALHLHPTVLDAVAVAHRDEGGNQRLVAYVVSGGKEISAGGQALPADTNGQRPAIELWPSVAEYFVYDDILYYAMTNDERRNDSYRVAINRAVKDKIILDIGTGADAILSRLCLEAGASKVYAIEILDETYRRAKATLERLGLQDRIILIHGDATKVQLPERVDVCVSEIVGAIGGSEGAAVIINDARRFLVQPENMIPQRSVTKFAAITLPEDLFNHLGFTSVPKNYTEKIFEQVGYKFDLRVCLKNFPKSNLMSDIGTFEDLDFTRHIEPDYDYEMELLVRQGGKLQGFLVWLTLQLAEDETLDILDHEYCWLPVYLPVFYPGVEVQEGDLIKVKSSGRLSQNQLNPDYRLRGDLIRQNGETVSFDYESFHQDARYQKHPFYATLFADDAVPLIEHKSPAASVDVLKEHLRARLPEYMVPASFLFLDALPLTPNGKVDRRSLPAPQYATQSSTLHIAPRTPVEELLAGIWGDVLKLEHPGIRDNFFELGGHSLLATQVISRVHEVLGVEVALRAMFEGPTIEALASAVEAAQHGGAQPARRVPIGRTAREPEVGIVLSFAQQRLWFLDQMEPGNAFYNIPMALRLRGEVDVAGLEWSLNEIIRRHETLRTRFATEGEVPVQVIKAEWRVRLEEEIVAGSRAERVEAAGRTAQAEARKGFDLAEGPLLRVRLLRLADDERLLLLTMHHIIADGWSVGVLVREVAALYEAHRGGTSAELSELPIQYADYAVWQREYLSGEVLEQQLAYWTEQLKDAPAVLELPSDYPRPPVQSFRGTALSFSCSPELSRALRAFSKGEGVTLYMTLLSAFAVLLYRYSGESEMVIGTPIANRNRVEVEGLIGFFVNTLALRVRVGGDPSFGELVKRVREVVLEAYEHQDVPFERIVEELKPERDLSRSPVFQVMMAWQNAPVEELELKGVKVSYEEAPAETAKYDLGLTMWERMGSGEVEGVIDYVTDMFEAERVRRMSEHFLTLLENIVAAPDEPISSLRLLSESETEGFQHLNTSDSGLSHEEFENILMEIKTALDE